MYDMSIAKERKYREHYDGNMLPNLETVLAKPNKKKFIVLHQYGSHFNFQSRYPQEYELFKPIMPASGVVFSFLDNKDKIINSYDNSILYTDYFLSEVIKKTRKYKDSLVSVVYISDHATTLFDDGETYLRSFNKVELTDFEIPYFIYFNNEYYKNGSETIKVLKEHSNSRASQESFFYTFLDIAGVKIEKKYYIPAKSLANPKYIQEDKRYMINGDLELKLLDEAPH
jgi:glucan phosphoethanolaminetransferase (alkaline phosphatase superfamily)